MLIPQRLIKLHAHSQPQLWQDRVARKRKGKKSTFSVPVDHHRRFLQLEHRNFLLYFKNILQERVVIFR